MTWNIYLSGEIHTDWRAQIQRAAEAADLPVRFTGPVIDHPRSDGIGEEILGAENDSFWRDHKSAKVNAIRTRNHMVAADVVVVRFGEKYKQWNAAFDAGYAAALNKPLIVMQLPEHEHALKEVDASALAVVERPEQVVEILKYCLQQK